MLGMRLVVPVSCVALSLTHDTGLRAEPKGGTARMGARRLGIGLLGLLVREGPQHRLEQHRSADPEPSGGEGVGMAGCAGG